MRGMRRTWAWRGQGVRAWRQGAGAPTRQGSRPTQRTLATKDGLNRAVWNKMSRYDRWLLTTVRTRGCTRAASVSCRSCIDPGRATYVAAAALADPVEAHYEERGAGHSAAHSVHKCRPCPAKRDIGRRPAYEREASDAAVENEADGEEDEADRHQCHHQGQRLPATGDGRSKLGIYSVLCWRTGVGRVRGTGAHLDDLEHAQRRRRMHKGPVPFWVRLQPCRWVVEPAFDPARGGHGRAGRVLCSLEAWKHL